MPPPRGGPTGSPRSALLRRLGLALVTVSLLVVWAGPLFLFVSWGLALGGFLLLARPPDTRRAALMGLGVLVLLVPLALVMGGVTLGYGGRRIATTPMLDASLVTVAAGFIAAWLALATFLVATEWPRGRRLAVWGAGLFAAACVAFTLDQLTRTRLMPGAGFEVPDVLLSFAFFAGGALLVVSLARQSLSRASA